MGGAITEVPGIEVGHFTDGRRPTGCTVLLAQAAAPAQPGSADAAYAGCGMTGTDYAALRR